MALHILLVAAVGIAVVLVGFVLPEPRPRRATPLNPTED